MIYWDNVGVLMTGTGSNDIKKNSHEKKKIYEKRNFCAYAGIFKL